MSEYFNFEHPEYLWWLTAIVLFGLLYAFAIFWRRQAMRRIGEPGLVKPLLLRRSRTKPVVRLVLLSIGFTGLVLALCNPRTGAKEKKVKSEGIDVVVAMDVSNSMYSADMQPDRLGVAKIAINNLIQQMHGDRIGLVEFAGDAFTNLPVTDDYTSAMQSIKSMTPDDIAAQGTALGEAIDQAMKAFGDPKEDEVRHSKAIIIVSDGEGHDDNVAAAVTRATTKGVIVCTIGVGTEKGAPVPEYYNGLPSGSYKSDESGRTVMSHLDENMMKDIAAKGNGVYLHADNSGDITSIRARLNALPKVETTMVDYKDFEDQYFWYAFGAFVVLLLETAIGDRTYKLFEKKHDPFKHARRTTS